MIDTEEIRNKKILVTGGAGFIGSNLCEELINLGAFVRCLDNLSTGNKSNISNKFSIDWMGNKRNRVWEW